MRSSTLIILLSVYLFALALSVKAFPGEEKKEEKEGKEEKGEGKEEKKEGEEKEEKEEKKSGAMSGPISSASLSTAIPLAIACIILTLH